MEALTIACSIAKVFEGFKSKPYLCPALVWTIGYGTTVYPNGIRVKKDDKPVSIEEAEEFLWCEMEKAINSTLKYCPGLITSDKRLAAIADFVYNLGAGRLQQSTLRRRINQEDWEEVRKELIKWVFASGRKLPGLVKRREVESSYI